MIRRVVVGCLVLMGTIPGWPADNKGPFEESASRILDAAGTKGGLIVHLGCGDGRLTAALRCNQGCIVRGLDADPANVQSARKYIEATGLYGPVSVDRFDGHRLPFADNLVNLLIVSRSSSVDKNEHLRVLAPGGVAVTLDSGLSTLDSFRKPWPQDIDEWTHWLHGPDGNAVAQDCVVGPPQQLQWIAKPLWSRHHDTVPTTTAMVSAAGRLFTISDEAPACLDASVPDKWFLVARDAFNGVLLWKRPITDWGWNQWGVEWRGRFNIPVELPKRLVADGDRVFVTLGFHAPVAALDAATGDVLRVYDGTENADEILFQHGLLILSLNQETRIPSADDHRPVKKSVCVIDADTGKMLWKTGDYIGLLAKYNASEPFGRLELAASGDQIFLSDHDALVSLDLKSGQQLWRIPRPPFQDHLVMYNIRMSDQCVLVYQDGIVLFAQPEMQKKRSWHTLPGTLHAYRAADGKHLWQHQYGGWAHNWQPDVFVIKGLVWVHEHIAADFPGHEPRDKSDIDYAVIGLDLQTGELKRRFSTKKSFDVGHHHRCYRGKATERFLIPSRRGAEFLDLATEENLLNHWARAGCLLGFVPCNGMLYLAPHPCQCYIATKLNGYVALAPGKGSRDKGQGSRGEGQRSRVEGQGSRVEGQGARDKGQGARAADRLERGPAFAQALDPSPSTLDLTSAWPTYRHDAARRASTTATMSDTLKPLWQARLDGRLSAPVIANGRLYVASVDEHCVIALDAGDGHAIWSYTTGARVDTPPTIDRGLALFGSADGWVYCVRASDGQLVWRRRLAPTDRYVGAFGQIESAWPVHGCVLVQNQVAYTLAGRSSYLDDGIVAYALDPATGEVRERKTIYSPDPKTGEMPLGDAHVISGALTDVLVGDGTSVFLRGQLIFGSASNTKPVIQSTAGLLDDSWFNRTQWTVGGTGHAQLLVCNERTLCGVRAYPGSSRNAFFQPGGKGCELFAGRWQTQTPRKPTKDKKGGSPKRKRMKSDWTIHVPVRVTAMVLAGDRLLAAGTPDVIDPNDPLAALEGRAGGVLKVIATANGNELCELQLESPPVYDGLAVSGRNTYLVTINGQVICLGGT